MVDLSAKCAFTYPREPYKPCSSDDHKAILIVLFGCKPAAFKILTASITTALPAALSVAPVAANHESM
ncbi:hypothetical protein D3C80_2038910 [compost metagenome]